MSIIENLTNYHDEQGNIIEYEGCPLTERARINFIGKKNSLRIAPKARLNGLNVTFYGNGAVCTIGDVGITPKQNTLGYSPQQFSATIILGTNCRIHVGDNTTTSGAAKIIAAESSAIEIGCDCMLAGGVEITNTDWHLIFDVPTGQRLNQSRHIDIGNHVWIGGNVLVLSGSRIGDGSVIGAQSVVKTVVPNNCTASGVPARILRRNIAWERTVAIPLPHCDPYQGGFESVISGYSQGENRSPYWQMTKEEDEK